MKKGIACFRLLFARWNLSPHRARQTIAKREKKESLARGEEEREKTRPPRHDTVFTSMPCDADEGEKGKTASEKKKERIKDIAIPLPTPHHLSTEL